MSRTWTPRRFMARRRARVIIAAMVVVMMFVATFLIGGRKTVSITINGETRQVSTYAMSVDRLLESQGVTVKSHDLVDSTSGKWLTDHAAVTVRSAYQVELTIDGARVPYWTVAQSVSQLLSFFNQADEQANAITVNITNVYNQLTGGLVIDKEGPVKVIADGKESIAPDGRLTAASILDSKGITLGKNDRVNVEEGGDMPVLRVQRITQGQEQRDVPIDFTTVTVVNDSLEPGETRVASEGVKGVKRQTYDVTYVDGKADTETLVSEVVTKQPENRVIEVGPAKASTDDDNAGSSTDSKSSGTDANTESSNAKSDANTGSSSSGKAGSGTTGSGAKDDGKATDGAAAGMTDSKTDANAGNADKGTANTDKGDGGQSTDGKGDAGSNTANGNGQSTSGGQDTNANNANGSANSGSTGNSQSTDNNATGSTTTDNSQSANGDTANGNGQSTGGSGQDTNANNANGSADSGSTGNSQSTDNNATGNSQSTGSTDGTTTDGTTQTGSWHLNPTQAKALARGMMRDYYGWGDDQYACLVPLWEHESGWQWDAENASSGAYGIPQALPPDKMGEGWRDDVAVQISWGLSYFKDNPKYGTPCGAWTWWQAHKWY